VPDTMLQNTVLMQERFSPAQLRPYKSSVREFNLLFEVHA